MEQFEARFKQVDVLPLVKQGFTDLESVDKVCGLVQDAINKTGWISRGLCPTHIAEKELELTLQGAFTSASNACMPHGRDQG